MGNRRSDYLGGSTIINPRAEARANGNRVQGTYTITRIDLIHQIKQGNWDVGYINNKKLYGEIIRDGGVECWALNQPELQAKPNDEDGHMLPIPPARKPPRNRQRR